MEIINFQEGTFRFLCFISFVLIFMACEFIFPLYKRTKKTFIRWGTNFLFVIIDVIMLRLTFPLLAVGFASICVDRGFGILNNISLPFGLSLLISIVLLVLGIWFEDFLFDRFKIFWRFHTCGQRFDSRCEPKRFRDRSGVGTFVWVC